MPVPTTPEGWRVLRLSSEVPPTPLFFLYTRRWDGVRLHVTDLISLWDYATDQDQLVEENLEQRPSINPCESNSQYDAFCAKLRESLETGLNSIQAARIRGGVNVLQLSTHLDLPKPLKPLAWTFELRQRDQTEFACQIPVSALEALLREDEQQRSLLKIIQEKDHVISKLLDKIDASGIDLGLIFPGISGSKSRRSQVSLNEASRQVPGIAAFDLQQWTKRNRKPPYNSLNITSLASTFANTFRDFDEKNAKFGISKVLESEDNRRSTKQAVVPRKRSRSRTPEAQIGSRSTSADFEDDPRSPAKGRKTASTPKSIVADSSSESDLNKTSQSKQKQFTRSTLGTVKARNLDSLLTANASRSPRAATANSSSSSDSEQKQPPKSSINKKASKLGKIGGRSTRQEQSASPPPSKVASNVSTPSRRLGMIGGRKTATPERRVDSPLSHSKQEGTNNIEERKGRKKITDDGNSDATASASPSPSIKQTRRADVTSVDPGGEEHSLSPRFNPPAPATEPETEEEAAARRREELKRTIHQNDKGKKKRKF